MRDEAVPRKYRRAFPSARGCVGSGSSNCAFVQLPSVGEGRVDLLVGGELIVELKSVEQLAAVHVAQVISYLKAFDRPLGLLITFNVKLLRSGVRRVVLSRR